MLAKSREFLIRRLRASANDFTAASALRYLTRDRRRQNGAMGQREQTRLVLGAWEASSSNTKVDREPSEESACGAPRPALSVPRPRPSSKAPDRRPGSRTTVPAPS